MVAMIDFDIGTMTRKTIVRCDAPSMVAASTRLSGIDSKKLFIRMT